METLTQVGPCGVFGGLPVHKKFDDEAVRRKAGGKGGGGNVRRQNKCTREQPPGLTHNSQPDATTKLSQTADCSLCVIAE